MGKNANNNKKNNSSSFLSDLKKSFSRISEDSLTEYLSSASKSYSLEEQTKHKDKLLRLPEYLREYVNALISLGYIKTTDELVFVCKKIINIKKVIFYRNGIGNCADIKDDFLFLSPSSFEGRSLSGDDIFRLNLYILITKYLHSSWKKDFSEVSSKYDTDSLKFICYNLYNALDSINNGIDVLDEVISEEVAENVFYETTKKTRPKKSEFISGNGKTYLSNWEYNPSGLSKLGRFSDYIFDNEARKNLKNDSDVSIISEEITRKNIKSLCDLSFKKKFIGSISKKSQNEMSFMATLAALGNDGYSPELDPYLKHDNTLISRKLVEICSYIENITFKKSPKLKIEKENSCNNHYYFG